MPIYLPGYIAYEPGDEIGPDGEPVYVHKQLCACSQCGGRLWQTHEVIDQHEVEDKERKRRVAEERKVERRKREQARRAQKREEERRKRGLGTEAVAVVNADEGAYSFVSSMLEVLTGKRRSHQRYFYAWAGEGPQNPRRRHSTCCCPSKRQHCTGCGVVCLRAR